MLFDTVFIVNQLKVFLCETADSNELFHQIYQILDSGNISIGTKSKKPLSSSFKPILCG